MTTFGEPVGAGFRHVFEGESLYSGRSEFQKIDVYQHPHFGRVLTLDDTLQTSENEEFCYHEMLVHPALASLERVEHVLIIGGGDGGTLRHVLQHDPVEAVMCEIDGEVVRVSQELLPDISAGAFDDPRGRLVIGDGAAFVAEHTDHFDAILVDSTDPVGAAEVLFSVPFYEACLRALRPGGIFVSQTGSPMYQGAELQRALRNLGSIFAVHETYLGLVPIYPGVLWSYTAGTRGVRLSEVSQQDIARRLQERGVPARFYTPAVHISAFQLPTFVREFIEGTSATPFSRR